MLVYWKKADMAFKRLKRWLAGSRSNVCDRQECYGSRGTGDHCLLLFFRSDFHVDVEKWQSATGLVTLDVPKIVSIGFQDLSHYDVI